MLVNLEKYLKIFQIYPKGFVQVGAHLGNEVEIFQKLNSNANIYLFEPQKILYEKLILKFSNNEKIKIFNCALGNEISKLTMYKDLNNDSQSSSFLKPKDHLIYHSYIEFRKDEEETIEINTLDSYKLNEANILCVDVQGYELNVLKGSTSSLKNFEALLIEVNRKELYEDCPHISEIDSFLKKHNFLRVVTKWWKKTIPWGDALYIQKNKIPIFKRLVLSVYNFVNQKNITFYLLSKVIKTK